MRLFQRFPVALVQAVVVPILVAVTPLIVHNENAAGAVNIALLALGGVVAAFGVSVDAALPLLTGAAKAVVAAVLAFGVDIPEPWQVAALTVLSILVAAWTHTQVTAKVAAKELASSVVRRATA